MLRGIDALSAVRFLRYLLKKFWLSKLLTQGVCFEAVPIGSFFIFSKFFNQDEGWLFCCRVKNRKGRFCIQPRKRARVNERCIVYRFLPGFMRVAVKNNAIAALFGEFFREPWFMCEADNDVINYYFACGAVKMNVLLGFSDPLKFVF